MTAETEPVITPVASGGSAVASGGPAAVPVAAGLVAPAEAPPRRLLAQNWRRLALMGAVAAGVQAFIALSGMPIGLDRRLIVAPVLSLGYLSLLWLPLVVGHRLGHQEELEGVPRHAAGWHEVLGGALVGAVSGSGLSVLLLLVARFDLRDPLINWSPQLADQLSFGRGTAFGAVVWLAAGAGLGAGGGGLRLLPTLVRRALVAVFAVVAGASVLELLLSDLLDGIGGEALVDWLYAKRGGADPRGGRRAGCGGGGGSRVRARTLEGGPGLAGPSRRPRSHPGEHRPHRGRRGGVHGGAHAGGEAHQRTAGQCGAVRAAGLGAQHRGGPDGHPRLGVRGLLRRRGLHHGRSHSRWLAEVRTRVVVVRGTAAVIVVAGLTGLFIGAPVIRMRGDYLAIVTLGFGEIIRLLFLSDWLSGWFGGAQGITNIGGVDVFGLAKVSGTDPRSVFYLVLAFCALAVYVSWRLEHSRIGRAWMAVREDETVAQAMGVNTVNAKLLAFVVGAVLGSFSGAIFAAKVGSVFPTSFMILVSIIILVVVIFGGMGNIAGVMVGAAVLIGVLGGPKQPGLLQEFSEVQAADIRSPARVDDAGPAAGADPSVRRTRELHHDEYLQDAWLKGHIDVGDHHDDDKHHGFHGRLLRHGHELLHHGQELLHRHGHELLHHGQELLHRHEGQRGSRGGAERGRRRSDGDSHSGGGERGRRRSDGDLHSGGADGASHIGGCWGGGCRGAGAAVGDTRSRCEFWWDRCFERSRFELCMRGRWFR